MIGLSFSGCIKDLLLGRVSVEQIDKLIVGCVWRNQAELESLIEAYLQDYWFGFGDFTQEQILALVEQLEGKIEMPRLTNPPRCPLIEYDYWVNSEDEINWQTPVFFSEDDLNLMRTFLRSTQKLNS